MHQNPITINKAMLSTQFCKKQKLEAEQVRSYLTRLIQPQRKETEGKRRLVSVIRVIRVIMGIGIHKNASDAVAGSTTTFAVASAKGLRARSARLRAA